jgi:hypothetical protein
METLPAFPLASAVKVCMKAFNLLVSRLEVSVDEHKKLMPPSAVQNQRDRFKIWAGNLGALQQGRASIDFRLRESSLMQTIVLRLLNQLEDTITKSKPTYCRFRF